MEKTEIVRNRPITPDEARSMREDYIPESVYAAINELIVEKFDGKKSVVEEREILMRAVDEDKGLTREVIYERHYLDVEPFYRKHGWKVEYDKPGYNESYPATFTFSV